MRACVRACVRVCVCMCVCVSVAVSAFYLQHPAMGQASNSTFPSKVHTITCTYECEVVLKSALIMLCAAQFVSTVCHFECPVVFYAWCLFVRFNSVH